HAGSPGADRQRPQLAPVRRIVGGEEQSLSGGDERTRGRRAGTGLDIGELACARRAAVTFPRLAAVVRACLKHQPIAHGSQECRIGTPPTGCDVANHHRTCGAAVALPHPAPLHTPPPPPPPHSPPPRPAPP